MRSDKNIITGISDETVMWRMFKCGNKDAYEQLYTIYSPLLFRYGCKIVSDREVVKDCLHDLFTELWKNKANLGDPASVKNYLIKSMRNRLIKTLDKESKFVNADGVRDIDYGEVISHELSIIYSQVKAEQRKQLIAAIKKLSNQQKEIIFLLFYGDMSAAEVSAILSVSVRTIYNTTFNAIQALKSEMIMMLMAVVLAAMCA